MPQHKQDIRSLRTKQALADALNELLKKNAFQNITVNDLCRKASISRTTFYLHFEDKFGLVMYCMEEFRKVIVKQAESMTFGDITSVALGEIGKNQRLFYNLLQDRDGRVIEQRINAAFYKDNIEYYKAKQAKRGKDYDVPLELIAVFNAAGYLNLIIWWINGEFSLSKEEMAEYMNIMHNCNPYI